MTPATIPCQRLTEQCARGGIACRHCAAYHAQLRWDAVKLEDLRDMPVIKSRVSKSRDGKYLIQRTTITSIKPVVYYEAILNGKMPVVEETEDEMRG